MVLGIKGIGVLIAIPGTFAERLASAEAGRLAIGVPDKLLSVAGKFAKVAPDRLGSAVAGILATDVPEKLVNAVAGRVAIGVPENVGNAVAGRLAIAVAGRLLMPDKLAGRDWLDKDFMTETGKVATLVVGNTVVGVAGRLLVDRVGFWDAMDLMV